MMMAAVKAKPQPKKEERVTLHGVRRAEIGRGAIRGLRTQGLVPGVVYGKKTEAIPIALNSLWWRPQAQSSERVP